MFKLIVLASIFTYIVKASWYPIERIPQSEQQYGSSPGTRFSHSPNSPFSVTRTGAVSPVVAALRQSARHSPPAFSAIEESGEMVEAELDSDIPDISLIAQASIHNRADFFSNQEFNDRVAAHARQHTPVFGFSQTAYAEQHIPAPAFVSNQVASNGFPVSSYVFGQYSSSSGAHPPPGYQGIPLVASVTKRAVDEMEVEEAMHVSKLSRKGRTL